MNKTKMMLAATGGAIGLAVLVMAYFTWASYSAKTKALEGDEEGGTEGLETVLTRARTLSRKPVYPCQASLTAIESNRTAIVEWQAEAKKLAQRGDRVFAKTTPAAFKEFLVSDAKRLSALPGSVAGVLVKPDFAFGPFKDYISGGKMPADAELAGLQRKWDDVATVVEVLSRCGIAELTDVQFAAAAGDNAEEAKDQRSKGRERKSQKNAKKASAPQAETSGLGPQTVSYAFSFTTRPAALVKVLNAFVVSERFITVEGFTFSRQKDSLAEALGGDEKSSAAAAASASGRRRRRGAAAAAADAEKNKEEGEGANKNGIVTDPLSDAPFAVVLKVNVRDFRSLEETKEEVKK